MWYLGVLIFCVFNIIIECDARRRTGMPCGTRDTTCHTIATQLAYIKLVEGVPSLGIESSDPLYNKESSGIINKFIYNFTDVNTTGLKGCVVNDVRLNEHLDNMKLNLACANVKFEGTYDIKGEFLGKKFNNSSNFTTSILSFTLAADIKLNHTIGDDGKKYLMIVDVRTTTTVRGPKNTHLNKNKELQKFINENPPTDTSKWIGRVYIDPNMQTIASRANIFLKSIPIDGLFLKD
ncbi:hypothetical protein O0L34_g15445 [Tuta absoluta]|nr:hypothetical protein O0L34_g15445 [Tuta absoluta]